VILDAAAAHTLPAHCSQLLIHIALKLGRADCIPAILAAAPDTISEEDDEGRLPLNAAIDDGQLEAVQAILASVPAAASLVSSAGFAQGVYTSARVPLHLCPPQVHALPACLRWLHRSLGQNHERPGVPAAAPAAGPALRVAARASPVAAAPLWFICRPACRRTTEAGHPCTTLLVMMTPLPYRRCWQSVPCCRG